MERAWSVSSDESEAPNEASAKVGPPTLTAQKVAEPEVPWRRRQNSLTVQIVFALFHFCMYVSTSMWGPRKFRSAQCFCGYGATHTFLTVFMCSQSETSYETKVYFE